MNINEIITKYRYNLEQSNILFDIQKVYDNNKKNYPILLFPKIFEERIYKQSEITNFGNNAKNLIVPNFPTKPREPVKQTAFIRTDESYIEQDGIGAFWNFIIVYLGTAFIGAGSYMYIANKFGTPVIFNILLFICCFILLPYYLNKQFPKEDKRIKYSETQREILKNDLQKKYDSNYKAEYEKYKPKYEEYLKKEKEYQRAIALYNNNSTERKTAFNRYVEEIIIKNIKNISSVQFQRINHPIVREGTTENLLFLALEKKFPKYLKIDTMIMGYYPDLTLWVDGVGIDIEIDEPYTFENGVTKEIHYLLDYNGISVDKSRNDTFVANNWFVLRFAESQIKNNLQDCVQIIQCLINFISSSYGNLNYLKELNNLSNRISTNTWTKENARRMARTNYRIQ